MVNEREEDRYEGEEGEYHFSDDQMNYDTETETPKEEERPIAAPSALSKIGAMTSRRRAILAGVIFIILMGVVYKLLSPSNVAISTVPAEFNTANQTIPTKTPTPVAAMPTINEPPKPILEAPKAPAVENKPPVEAVSPPVVQNQMVPPPAAVAPSAPSVVTTETPQSVTTVTTTPTAPTSQEAVSPPPLGTVLPQKSEAEKLISLEQQNTAIMNLLQTEYAQKMADYEAQNTQLRGKIDEISKKMNRVESNLNQITHLLQGDGRAEWGPPPGRSQKVTYHVQAIIPGRAWLKSEAGDTVTVAEGDILRNVGRVTKIDPYDGIVEINVGNKVITLSYGMGAD